MNIYLYRDNQHIGPYTSEQMSEMVAQGQVAAGESALAEGSSTWRTVGDLIGADPPIYVTQDGQQSGPYTLEQINIALVQGSLQSTAFAFYEGMSQWVGIAEIPGVVVQVPSIREPAPKTMAAKPSDKGDGVKPLKTVKPKKGLSRNHLIAVAAVTVVALTGLIWFFFLRSTSLFDTDNPDHQAIEAAIRVAIAKPKGELTEGDFQKVIKLDLPGKSLKDISPLAKLIALEELDLAGNQLENIEPLSGLKSLKMLNLSGNKLSDLKQVESLNNMETLDVSGNQLEDISSLAGMGALRNLRLGGNKVGDVQPLANLSKLEALDLGGNQISNASPLAGLENLQMLNLGNNQLKDISELSKLKSLQILVLQGNPVDEKSAESLRKALPNCHLEL